MCQEIEEDIHGNLWIGTFQSLEKYNGANNASFNLTKKNNIQTPVVNLFDDQAGNIWVLQGQYIRKIIGGIDFYRYKYNITIIDPITDNRLSFNDYINSESIKEDEIRFIQKIGEVLYLITEDNQIYTFAKQLELIANISDSSALLYVKKENEFYSITENNIDVINRQGKQLHSVADTIIRSFDSYTIAKTGELFFYEISKDSVYFYEYHNKKIEARATTLKSIYTAAELKYFAICKTPDGHILINDRLYHQEKNKQSPITNYISNRSVFDYHVSKTGLIYVTTNNGVYIFKNREEKFKTIFQSENKDFTNSVRAIMVSEDLIAFKENKKEVITSPSGLYDLSFLSNMHLGDLASMHYIDPLDNSKLWSVGYIVRGTRLIDLDEKKVTNYAYSKSYPRGTYFILRASFNNKMYIASYNGLYTINNKQTELIETKGTQNIIISQIIDKNKQLWLPSSSGLLIYELEQDTIYNKKFCSENYSLQFIHEDKTDDEVYWLGTSNHGLIRWNIATDECEIYDDKNGLSNNNVHAILEDNSNRLWISTNRYLNCLDKESRSISIFSEQDGISHSEFNKYSYCIDSTNNLFYFGGLDGYTYFCPDSIATKSSQNNIQINIVGANKIKENAEYENIYTEVAKNNCIEILDDDISVLLDLSSNYHANSNNREFYYKIPTINSDWTKITGKTLTISRLPYGLHNLELISDKNKPASTSNVISIPVNVIKPFKKTWTYFILTSLLGIFIVWFLVNRYLQNVRERNTKLEILVDERTKELKELNDTKNKIFTILAHDLKNPILAMSDLADKIKFLTRKNRLDEIEILAGQTKSRVNALNDNLNNVLAWAMSENNIQSGRKEMYSLHLEIKKILQLYSTEIENKKLTTEINIDVIDQVHLNINVLQTILRNYIHNAIKFSYPSGTIFFSRYDITQNRVTLEIKDNGIGMSASDTFGTNSPAKKIKEAGEGFGLGMRVSQGLAEKAGITITTKSSSESGTSVYIDMPRKANS